MMSTTLSSSRVAGLLGSFFVHVAAVFVGFVLMIVGLGLGVTIIMLPVGLVVGSWGSSCSSAGCSLSGCPPHQLTRPATLRARPASSHPGSIPIDG